MAGWLYAVAWTFWAGWCSFGFFGVFMEEHRQRGTRAPTWMRRCFGISRRIFWGSYWGWAACGFLLDAIEHRGIVDRLLTTMFTAFMTWLCWRCWKRYKDLDDDDWLKRLLEAGSGFVERVGNRLKVVVPAPSPA